MNEEKQILLLTQKVAAEDDPSADGLHTIGTLATVLQPLEAAGPDGAACWWKARRGPGGHRLHQPQRFLPGGRSKISRRCSTERRETEALVAHGQDQFRAVYQAQRKNPVRDIGGCGGRSTSRRELADTVAAHLSVKISDRPGVAGNPQSTTERLEKVLSTDRRRRSASCRSSAKSVRGSQAIQKELGEGEEGRDEMNGPEKSASARPSYSKEAREKADGRSEKASLHVAR